MESSTVRATTMYSQNLIPKRVECWSGTGRVRVIILHYSWPPSTPLLLMRLPNLPYLDIKELSFDRNVRQVPLNRITESLYEFCSPRHGIYDPPVLAGSAVVCCRHGHRHILATGFNVVVAILQVLSSPSGYSRRCGSGCRRFRRFLGARWGQTREKGWEWEEEKEEEEVVVVEEDHWDFT